MMRKRILATLLALTLLSCKSGPSAAPQTGATGAGTGGDASGAVVGGAAAGPSGPVGAPKELRTIEGITEYALDNGMRVLLFPDPSNTTVTVNVTYLVGSRHEGYGETGMAHLLEHMLFKGSPKHPAVWTELETRGASNNATTWYDRTNYFETLPATGDNLAWALEMEADRMVNANIAEADLRSEFTVVRNEFEMGENDPSAVMSERMWSTAYLWHNYGKSTIGSRSDIELVPADRLKAFYKKYYRPDNATLVVAGKFEKAAALALINETFGAIPRPASPLPPDYTVEPVQDGEREVTLRRVGDVAIVGLVYHSVAGTHADFEATTALAQLLTDEPSGRLYQALVKTGLATSVSANTLPLHDPGVIEFYATIGAGKPIGPVRDKMIEIVEGFARTKITDEEIARYRAKSKKAFKLFFTRSERVATEISESVALGDWRMFFISRDRAEKVDAAQVQRVAATYLVPANRTLGTFIPTKAPVRAPLESRPELGPIVDNYKGRDAASEGEKFEASISNIEKRTKRVKLPNGMQLAMLAKETRGDAVRARLTLRFGTERDLRGQATASIFLADLMARGTTKHTFQQLKDEWDRLEAQVSFSSEPGELTVGITTVRDNLPDVLTLVDEVLTQPTFPADQFQISTKEYLTSLEEQRSDPQQQGFKTLFRTLRPYDKDDPRYTATTDEEIARTKALKLDQVKKLHGFLGASHATMTVVGDFDPALVQPQVEKLFGNWKSRKPYKRLESKYTEVPAGHQQIDTPDKEMAIIAAGYNLAMRDDDADYPAMTIVNYVLGGGGFSSRLMDRLRSKDGLSYGAFSFYQSSALDTLAVLVGGAIVAPQNAAKGMAAMLEEFEKLVKDGIPADELDKAKKAYLQDFDRNLTNDGFVLSQLDDGLFVGRTLEFWAQVNAKIAALTPEQANAAVKKYVKPAALVKVTAGDKKKAEAAPAK